jgi:hypothetical protein
MKTGAGRATTSTIPAAGPATHAFAHLGAAALEMRDIPESISGFSLPIPLACSPPRARRRPAKLGRGVSPRPDRPAREKWPSRDEANAAGPPTSCVLSQATLHRRAHSRRWQLPCPAKQRCPGPARRWLGASSCAEQTHSGCATEPLRRDGGSAAGSPPEPCGVLSTVGHDPGSGNSFAPPARQREPPRARGITPGAQEEPRGLMVSSRGFLLLPLHRPARRSPAFPAGMPGAWRLADGSGRHVAWYHQRPSTQGRDPEVALSAPSPRTRRPI